MALKNFQHKIFIKVFVVLFLVIAEIVLLFFIPRSNFFGTYSLFLLLFAGYFFVVKRENIFDLKFCIALAILLRCIALFNVPVLSDDYFRFIWDGKMSLMHVNPFTYTPLEYLQNHPSTSALKHLYDNMNSQEYHTIYPALLQFLFWFATWIGGDKEYIAFVIMKIFILFAELGTMRILWIVAQKQNIKTRKILWYVLNPLIIIELTGNLHFEGIMLFFFIAFFYFLSAKKYLQSAIFWAFSICTKMIPLMLAPLILRYIGFKKFIVFGIVSSVVIIALFSPFINFHFIKDMSASLRLFFHLFEFNASVFYFIKWITAHYVTYDIIEQTAPVLGFITFIMILCISWWPAKKFSFAEKSLWIFSVYFLFSTMVHPWYSAVLIMLSAVTKWRFPIAFSLLILLSYFPYCLKIYDEDLNVILAEYLLLFAFMIWEVRTAKRRSIELV